MSSFSPSQGAKSGRAAGLLSVAVMALLVVLPLWKLLLMKGCIITNDVVMSDIMNEDFPYRYSLWQALKAGERPFWMTEIYGGFPLLARGESSVLYPFNLLLFGLLDPYAALNVSILLTVLVAGIGIYLLARQCGSARAGAAAAGVAFAWSGFMAAHMKHLSLVATGAWLPWGLFALERAVANHARRPAPGAVEGAAAPLAGFCAVLAVQQLAGHFQMVYFCGLAYGAYFLLRVLINGPAAAASGGRRAKVRLLLMFVASVLTAMCLGAVQTLPTRELAGLSQRASGITYEYASRFKYDPANLITFLFPYARGDISDLSYTGKSVFREDYGYAGILTFMLAAAAVIRGWRRPHVKAFAVMAAASYLVVLGPNTPLYRVLFHVLPGMKFFRFPQKMLLVTDAALAVLAALGLTMILESVFKGEGNAARRRRGLFGWLAAALVFADLAHFQPRQNPMVDAEAWRRPPETAVRLGREKGEFRVFSPAAGLAHRDAFAAIPSIHAPDGYAQLAPEYVVDLWGDQNRTGAIGKFAHMDGAVLRTEGAFIPILSMFNVKFVLSPFEVVSDRLKGPERIGPAFLYENPAVLGRAYLVASSRAVSGREEALSVITTEGFDPTREAVIIGEPPEGLPGGGTPGSAHITRYGRNEVVIKVNSVSKALLVLSDTFYPGWIAEVGGVETTVLQANLMQRAVEVPAGRHTVRFHFRPRSVETGAAVSLSGLVMLALFFVLGRRVGSGIGN